MQPDESFNEAQLNARLRDLLPLNEAARACGLSETEIHELLDYGVLAAEFAAGEPRLPVEQLVSLRRASAVRRDFDLDLFAMGILVGYIDRIEALEREVVSLRARVSWRGDEGEGGRWREPR